MEEIFAFFFEGSTGLWALAAIVLVAAGFRKPIKFILKSTACAGASVADQFNGLIAEVRAESGAVATETKQGQSTGRSTRSASSSASTDNKTDTTAPAVFKTIQPVSPQSKAAGINVGSMTVGEFELSIKQLSADELLLLTKQVDSDIRKGIKDVYQKALEHVLLEKEENANV